MANMEAKLAAFRERKEAEKQAEQSLINKLKLVLTNKSEKSENQDLDVKSDGSGYKITNREVFNRQSTVKRNYTRNTDDAEEENLDTRNQPATVPTLDTSETSTTTNLILKMLKCLLWLTLWGLFIELQFGAVFFAASLLLFVYFNTRTGPKDNKPSAYSVFNKDCERIQGTLTAEQLQKNMFGVPGLPS